jgi:opacity protein-like surface antigen
MRLRYFCGALLFAAFCSLPSAFAQAEFDIGLGFGVAHDGSTNQGIEGTNSLNQLAPCSPATGAPYFDGYCAQTNALNNFMMAFGMNILLTKHYGFGGEVSFQPERPNYTSCPSTEPSCGPLLYRQTFYDFNGIYAPINEKRVQLEIIGGIGGAHTSFSVNESECVTPSICQSFTEPTGITANHFQVHVGAAVQIYVTDHIFVRPEYDFRYIPSFNTVFGSNVVNAAMVWVGFGWH